MRMDVGKFCVPSDVLYKAIECANDRTGFIDWLKKNPNETFVPNTASQCPMAKYLRANCDSDGKVGLTFNTIDDNTSWAGRFAKVVDASGLTQISSEQALEILATID